MSIKSDFLAFRAPLVVGLVVRLAMLALINVQIANDAATYDLSARNLLDQHVLTLATAEPFEPSAYRPPLYPAMIALVYGTLGRHLLAVQLAQMLLSLAAALLLARAAERLEPGLGVWTVWALALCPFDAVYTVVLLSESLAAFLLASALAAWALLDGRARWLALGIGLGLATLCRDIYIALAPFFAVLWLARGDDDWGKRWRGAAVVVVVALVTIAPWTIRNRVEMGRWIPVSAGRLGLSLWMGGWATDAASIGSEVDGERVWADRAFLDPADRDRVEHLADDLDAQERLYRSLFVERVQREPFAVFGRWMVRAPLLWLGTRFDIFELHPGLLPRGSPQWTATKIVLWGTNAMYACLALAGAVLAARRRVSVRWLAVPILFTALVYIPLNSFENRYSQPAYPFLALFAAFALRELWLRFQHRRSIAASA